MISAVPDGVVISVRVIPRAGRSEIAGVREGALLVRLNAPPVDGAANTELIEVLAEALDVSKRDISIASGMTSKQKRIKVSGIGVDRAASRLPH
jgi:uncharacterized protein